MRKHIEVFLCWIGLHRWKWDIGVPPGIWDMPEIPEHYYCKSCGVTKPV